MVAVALGLSPAIGAEIEFRSELNSKIIQIVKDANQEIREVVAGRMKSALLDMVYQLFENELHELCGPRYDRDRGRPHYRTGSDKGSILAQGQCIKSESLV